MTIERQASARPVCQRARHLRVCLVSFPLRTVLSRTHSSLSLSHSIINLWFPRHDSVHIIQLRAGRQRHHCLIITRLCVVWERDRRGEYTVEGEEGEGERGTTIPGVIGEKMTTQLLSTVAVLCLTTACISGKDKTRKKKSHYHICDTPVSRTHDLLIMSTLLRHTQHFALPLCVHKITSSQFKGWN